MINQPQQLLQINPVAIPQMQQPLNASDVVQNGNTLALQTPNTGTPFDAITKAFLGHQQAQAQLRQQQQQTAIANAQNKTAQQQNDIALNKYNTTQKKNANNAASTKAQHAFLVSNGSIPASSKNLSVRDMDAQIKTFRQNKQTTFTNTAAINRAKTIRQGDQAFADRIKEKNASQMHNKFLALSKNADVNTLSPDIQNMLAVKDYKGAISQYIQEGKASRVIGKMKIKVWKSSEQVRARQNSVTTRTIVSRLKIADMPADDASVNQVKKFMMEGKDNGTIADGIKSAIAKAAVSPPAVGDNFGMNEAGNRASLVELRGQVYSRAQELQRLKEGIWQGTSAPAPEYLSAAVNEFKDRLSNHSQGDNQGFFSQSAQDLNETLQMLYNSLLSPTDPNNVANRAAESFYKFASDPNNPINSLYNAANNASIGHDKRPIPFRPNGSQQ